MFFVICPVCGGSMEPDSDKHIWTCSFCGHEDDLSYEDEDEDENGSLQH